MSNLIDKINLDLISAQKAKDELTTSTLRLLLAEIHNAKIAKGEDMRDDEVIDVAKKSAKKHKESIEAFEKAQRAELVEKEKAELATVEKYLPTQLPQQEISKVVDEVVAKTGAVKIADMGKVMGQVMRKLRGKADGNVVLEIVKKKLSG